MTEVPALSKLGQAALKYAELGWRVFPLRPREQIPLSADGLASATTASAVVASWWRLNPDANIGLAIPSDRVVLNIKPDVLQELSERHGPLPATPRQSADGEQQVILTVDRTDLRAGEIAPGVCALGPGEYLVAAPSIHPSGATCQWEAGCRPSQLSPAPAPQWLIDMMAPQTSAAAPVNRSRPQLRVVNQAEPSKIAEPQLAPAAPARVRWLIDDWREHVVFKADSNQVLEPRAVKNATAMLLHRSDLAGLFIRNRRSGELHVRWRPPWTVAVGSYPRSFESSDIVGLQGYLEHSGLRLGAQAVAGAIEFAAHERACDPIADKLALLQWDQIQRLDHWLETYCGADDNSLTRQIGAKWMISAVARVVRPGCQVDHMLILEGPQRIGKSTALRTIAEALGQGIFTDRLSRLDSKDAMIELRGKVIVEMAELVALRGRSADEVKRFLTSREDNFRQPYARTSSPSPRSCVFAGTINPDGLGYLSDATGNGRFWPVSVKTIDMPKLVRDAPQLWAEAKARYDAGEHWWIEDEIVLSQLAATNMERTEQDVWAAKIDLLISDKERVTISEILKELGVETGKQSQREQRRVGLHLRKRGWVSRNVRRGDRVLYGYGRPDDRQSEMPLPTPHASTAETSVNPQSFPDVES